MIAIKACGLSKRYSLQTISTPSEYQTLSDRLIELGRMPLRLITGKNARSEHEWFWALRDVDFEVQQGEVVGIVGRNGNGKSTLLKILSKITSPTQGYADMTGRVCSLLEVGTGFHPELTGSENIFLNGSILGMSRREIQKKFDEIVSFSEVDQFLHMPVKRYSSGMRVRLAFSVAAHLDPDILIVDEVLAVGDLAFQQKCIQRMSEFASTGRTILFVSHNMPAVESLCQRTILVSGGRIVADGPTHEIVPQFIKSMVSSPEGLDQAETDLSVHPRRVRNSKEILQKLRIFDETGSLSTAIPLGGKCTFELSFQSQGLPRGLSFCISLSTPQGQRIGVLHSRIHSRMISSGEQSGTVRCVVDHLPLLPGEYTVDVSVGTWDRVLDSVDGAARIAILPTDYFGTGELPNSQQGVLALKSCWTNVSPQPAKAWNRAVWRC